MKTTEIITEILKQLSGVENISVADKLQEDLSLDSLALVTLLIEIEEIFKIQLDESDMNPFELNNVQNVIDLVDKYVGDKNE